MEIVGDTWKTPSFSILIIIVFIAVVFFCFFCGRPSTTLTKLNRIDNSGTKLARVWQNWGQNHLICNSEMRWKLRKMGWVYAFWWSKPLSTMYMTLSVVGPLKFSKIPLSDHDFHLKVLYPPPFLIVNISKLNFQFQFSLKSYSLIDIKRKK